ncbi:oxidoreductase domain-containing protein [Xylaria nigripes]|nr:oxidoreductase domain-containing protein [Xylaria nigripes]
MLSGIRKAIGSRGEKAPPKKPLPVKTNYRSKEIAIPDDFLKSPVSDSQPITHSPIDFESSVLPEYTGCYAVVLDHVLSPSECAQLLELAEASVMDEDKQDGSSWGDALVNIGSGYEIEVPDYRKSGRIIWDQQEIVDRLWDRMSAVPEIREKLSAVSGFEDTQYEFYRVNKRLRFLKYTPGQFFRAHCDGAYEESTPDGHMLMTFMTVHLYLNDSKQVVGSGADLVGGATSFLSRDESRKLDVDPKAGRVLIFQHKKLRHSGADVKSGTKYTVRTDIMYKLH